MIETIYSNPDFLMHHGVKGQKWGVRRYQNEDGSLTTLGKKHNGEGVPEKSTISSEVDSSVKKLEDENKKAVEYFNSEEGKKAYYSSLPDGLEEDDLLFDSYEFLDKFVSSKKEFDSAFKAGSEVEQKVNEYFEKGIKDDNYSWYAYVSRHFYDYFDPVAVIADNASYSIDDYDEYLKYHKDLSHSALIGAYFMGDDVYLEHHGVKGMKWGVRKDDRFGGKTAQEVSRDRSRSDRSEELSLRKDAVKALHYSTKKMREADIQKRKDTWHLKKDDRFGGKTASEVSRDTARKEGRKLRYSIKEYSEARKIAEVERLLEKSGSGSLADFIDPRKEQDIRRRTKAILDNAY